MYQSVLHKSKKHLFSMKKLIGLFTLVLVLSSFAVQAQYTPAPQYIPAPRYLPQRSGFRFYDIRFGVFLSPSWSWMTSDNKNINRVGSELGIKIGVIAEQRISEAYSFSTGLNITYNQGGTLQVNVPNHLWSNANGQFYPQPSDTLIYQSGSKFKYTMSYFEIPFGIKLRTPESGDHIRYFAEPHLAFGIKTSSTGSTVGLGYAGVYDQEKIPIYTEVNTFDFSFGIGAGAEFIVTNNTAFIFGLYYQSGLIDVTENNSGYILNPDLTGKRLESSNTSNNSLSIRLGVMF